MKALLVFLNRKAPETLGKIRLWLGTHIIAGTKVSM